MKNKFFRELKEKSLEDVYYYLCKNEPSKKSKIHNNWDYLESIAYEELLIEDERPLECEKIIDEICTFLQNQWKNKKNK